VLQWNGLMVFEGDVFWCEGAWQRVGTRWNCMLEVGVDLDGKVFRGRCMVEYSVGYMVKGIMVFV